MLEAKALLAQFLNKDGTDWAPWWTGWTKENGLLDKAKEQNAAAALSGRIVEYHFAEKPVADLVERLFREEGLSNIKIFWTPPDTIITKLPEEP